MAKDPLYPDRPDHPDFWALSRAVIALDEAAEERNSDSAWIEVLAKYVNPESLFYVIDQRWLRLVNDPRTHTAQKANVMKAAWIDGFIAAMKFMEERATVDGQHRG